MSDDDGTNDKDDDGHVYKYEEKIFSVSMFVIATPISTSAYLILKDKICRRVAL